MCDYYAEESDSDNQSISIPVDQEMKIRRDLDVEKLLILHSPAGKEPVVYKWPLISGRGTVSSILTASSATMFLFCF